MRMRHVACWLPVVLPPLLALYCLLELYVDLFFWDEWNMLLPFAMTHFTNGEYGWPMLWEDHFSHRPVLIKAISALNLRLFAGNQLPMLLVNWSGLLLLLFLAISRLRSIASFGSPQWCLMATMISFLLFTPAMALAWLWPICFVQVYASLFYCLAMLKTPQVNSPAKMCLLITTAVACTLTMANGVLVWPAILVLGAAHRLPARWLATFTVLGIVTIWLYFYGMHSPDESVSSSDHFAYALIFLGSPFSFGRPNLAIAWGAVGMTLYLVLTALMVRYRNRSLLVDLSLSWLAIASAAAGAFFRMDDLGPEQALVARYIPLSIPFWLSLLLAAFRAWKVGMSRTRCFAVGTSLVIGLAILLQLGSAKPIDPAAFEQSRHSFTRLAWEGLREDVFVASGNNPYVSLFPNPYATMAGIRDLRKHSLGMYRNRDYRTGSLGSRLATQGEVCIGCNPIGGFDTLEHPYHALNTCMFDLEQGTIASGFVSLKASKIADILIVDGRGTIVGKGFPIGQFRSGFDPTEALRWYPRRWIGFVAGKHLASHPEHRDLKAFARLRKTHRIVPLRGEITPSPTLQGCPDV